MYCRHCGKENLDDSFFCEHCGKKLRTVAPQTNHFGHHIQAPSTASEKNGMASAPSVPKPDRPQMQLRVKGRTLVTGALVILCVVLVAVLISRLETGGLGAKTVRICVMDGRKTTSVNYTGEAAGAQTTQYELFTITEDGLPSARHSVTLEDGRSEKTVVYQYDYDGVVMDYLDYAQRKEELTGQDRDREAMVIKKIYKPLESGEIDINEVDGYSLLGIEDSRVIAVFNYFGSDCLLKYDGNGNVTEQVNFHSPASEGLRDVITYSYTGDGKIREQKTTSFAGRPSYEFEYTYQSENEIQVRQTTIQEGSDPVTVEYRNENVYDDNGLILKNDNVINDFVMMSREYSYHFVELEVPKSTVELLCSVYDYMGIEYVLEGEGVSVKQTMTSADLNEAWAFFRE